MLYIETASYSNPGGHEINEDSFCCGSDFFAVADGLGGHINGEEASRCAVEYLKRNANGNYNEETVNELLLGANSAVLTGAAGAKTTIAVLFAENGVFRYANVGDSRVYIFHRDRVLAMTKDHSVCRAAVDMGTMEFDDIRQSEDRSRLLKVLGNNEKLNVPKGYPPIQMQEGDAFLICSDGFWDYVLESEMEADLLKSDSPQKWLTFMLKRHIAAAMNKGDNYTAICGMVKSKPEPAAVPAATPAPEAKAKSFPAALLIAVLIIAVVAIAAVFAIKNIYGGDIPDESTDTVTETEESTDTVTETGESTDTVTETGESTDTVTETGESTDTVTETEEGTDTVTETEESTDTVTETGESTDTVTETEETSDVTETTAESEEYTGIFGTTAEEDNSDRYPDEDDPNEWYPIEEIPPYINPFLPITEV